MTRRRTQLGLFVLVATLLAVAVARVNLDEVRRSLQGMSWEWAAAAAAVNLAGLAIDTARWRIVISAVAPVSFATACHAFLVGVAGNVVVPFKLGEGARAYMLAARANVIGATALTTVLLDRVIDAATLPVFMMLAGLVLPLPPSLMSYRPWAIALTAAGIAAGAAARRWIRRRRVSEAALHGSPMVDRIVAGLRVLDDRHRLAGAIAVALCSWSVRAAIVWCMFQAFGLPLPVSAAVATLGLINVGIALVATPGNIGTFELVTAGALTLWGVSPAEGLSLGVAMHVLEVVPAAALGAAGLLFSRGRLDCSSGRGSAW